MFNKELMNFIKKYLLYIFLSFISIVINSCTIGERSDIKNHDVTGKLHKIHRNLYVRKDTKISMVEHNSHDFLDTTFIIPEDSDTILFKTEDVSLHTLAKELNSKDAKFLRLSVKSATRSYFYRTKTIAKLPQDSYISVAYLCNHSGIVIKRFGAIKVHQFKVISKEQISYDMDQPMIFINRPTPTEKGSVYLDFILINQLITDAGNMIRITIDGKQFYTDKWVPLEILGLKTGRHKISVQIVNKDDEPLDNIFSRDTREFDLN